MPTVHLREPNLNDETEFLSSIKLSQSLHHPWVKAPETSKEFQEYLIRFSAANQKIYLVIDANQSIVGVFNISEIVRGLFQNAYLGFYAMADHAGKGYMGAGLKLVLKKVFLELKLHRLEANIQPENTKSINLIKQNNFRKEGYSPRYLKINNEWRDHERWAITYEDWQIMQK